MRVILPKGALVFDIGACMGERALEYLYLLPRKIVCVEPQLSCQDTLKNLSSLFPTVVLEPLAVSSTIGHIDFHLSTTNVRISTCSKKFMTNRRLLGRKWEKPTTIPTTTLDALIEKHGVPDFCKIDVEGHEAHVFEGLSHTLPLLSFEYHAQYQEEAQKCHDRLSNLGNYTYNFSHVISNQLALDDYIPWPELLKVFAQYDPDFACDIYALNN